MITNIPKHWKIKKLGEICKVNQGLQIAIEERFTEPIENGYFYITNEFLKANSKTKYYIKNPSKSVLCSKEDILMTRTGNTGIVVSDVEGVFHNNFFKIDYDKKLLHKDYFVYYLKNDRMQYDILVKAGNSTIPDLNHSDFYTLQIAIPPLEEQEKIAEILLSCDKAIRLTTQIITQLKQRNQGLAQQLLTGEKRVKGFENSVWKEVRLGEIGEISSAGVDKKVIEGEKPIRLLNYLDVYKRNFIHSDELTHWVTTTDEKIQKCNILQGDVFFTPSSEVRNDIAISAVAIEDIEEAVYSYHIVRLRFKKKIDLNFKAFMFKTDFFFKQAQFLSEGSGTRYVISQSNFRNIKIFLPTYEEQKIIGNILVKAEKELKLYEQKLQLLQAQKKTLMQKLLTGEVLTVK